MRRKSHMSRKGRNAASIAIYNLSNADVYNVVAFAQSLSPAVPGDPRLLAVGMGQIPPCSVAVIPAAQVANAARLIAVETPPVGHIPGNSPTLAEEKSRVRS